PDAVATTFDKIACLELWEDAGLPTPRRYSEVSNYGRLREAIERPHARVFVKLRYGYSAMGALAIEWRPGRVRAITTVETTGANDCPRFFVSKKPRVLRS